MHELDNIMWQKQKRCIPQTAEPFLDHTQVLTPQHDNAPYVHLSFVDIMLLLTLLACVFIWVASLKTV